MYSQSLASRNERRSDLEKSVGDLAEAGTTGSEMCVAPLLINNTRCLLVTLLTVISLLRFDAGANNCVGDRGYHELLTACFCMYVVSPSTRLYDKCW